MGNINKVFLSGRLTRDPDLRETGSGMQIMGFSVAVNDRRKNPQTGQYEDVANFVDCCMFGNRAESLSNILHKGQLVTLEGKLRYSSWEKDGQRRSKLEVIVDEIELPQRAVQEAQGTGYSQQQPQYDGGYEDDPIPF